MSTPDDTSHRFTEIMRAEFGDDPSFSPNPSPDEVARHERSRRPQRRPQPTQPPDEPGASEDFNLGQAMGRVEPDEPDEPFEPPAPAPLPRPKGAVLLGSLLLAAGILIGLMGLLGVNLGLHWGRWAVGGFVVGLVVLLARLPRQPRDPDDDGARV